MNVVPARQRQEREARIAAVPPISTEERDEPASPLGWLFVAAAVWLCLATPLGWLAARDAFSWGRALVTLPLGLLIWLVATACCATLDARRRTRAMEAFQGSWFALSVAFFGLSEGWRWVAWFNCLALVGLAGWAFITSRAKS